MSSRNHSNTRGFFPKAHFSFLKWISFLGSVLKAIATGRIFFAMHPRTIQTETVHSNRSAPKLSPGQKIKIMSWNVQFMAGKNYIFFFDVQDARGADERPSAKDIKKTIYEVARVIRAENPDIILLQEMDCGAARTDFEDQLARLLALLPSEYACYTRAFYWKAGFVPHPRVRGSAGITLAIISKYQIRSAKRYQLAIMPADPITQHFSMKRAMLEVRLPIAGGGEFAALTAHLSAFAQEYDTLERQVRLIRSRLTALNRAGTPWVLGGDFNLLSNKAARERLPEDQKVLYNPRTEIVSLLRDFQAVPKPSDMKGEQAALWYTHHPNHPDIKRADRTIDYLFFPKRARVVQPHVRQKDTKDLSDHFPVIAEYRLPG